MRVGYKAHADKAPQPLRINHLKGNIYELYATECVEEVKAKSRREEESAEPRTTYSYIEYNDTKAIDNYDSAVEPLIALKYTIGDEIALSRKDKASAEYIAYMAYVEACKAFARALFKS